MLTYIRITCVVCARAYNADNGDICHMCHPVGVLPGQNHFCGWHICHPSRRHHLSPSPRGGLRVDRVNARSEATTSSNQGTKTRGSHPEAARTARQGLDV
jgi:hypothetical protein